MTNALQSLRETGPRFLMIWVIPIVLVGLVSIATPVLNDGDTFWHIAAGRWMIAHGAVPATDPFSYTYAGHPWIAHEWLSEVVMAGAYLAAGWSGVMLLTGLAVGVLAALIGAWLLRWVSQLTAVLMLALGLACVSGGLLARPHLLVLPLLALWTIRLLKARETGQAPPLWTALLMALWANLHSSFVVGLLIAAALGLEALLDVAAWRRRTLIGWAAFLGASLVAALATPHGIEGLVFPLRVLDMKTLPAITEWQGPDFLKPSPLEFALLVGVFFAFWRGVKLTAVRAAIVLGLLHMSLQHVRQEVLLGVVAPLVLAEPMGRALGRSVAAPASWRMPAPQLALGAGLFVLILAGRLMTPQVRVDGPTAPISALAHVPPDIRRLPVLNHYDFGGYLIFEGVRPYIDGRADMYGDAFVADDDKIQHNDIAATDAALARYHIRWAILPPRLYLTERLETLPGWTKLYADKVAAVLVFDPNSPGARPSAPPPATAPRSSAPG
jgi:hypothetical protein